MKSDLHSHSTRSDGLLAPEALVELAWSCGVTHLALTDHDAVDGIDAARRAAAGRLEIIPGAEITAEFHGREVHLLALFVEHRHPAMQAFCDGARLERATRIERMVEALNAANVRVSMDDVTTEAAGATLARPHLARVLVKKGYAASQQRAFDDFLGPGCVADVPRRRPSLEEACALVRESGGVSSIAHPGVNRISKQELSVAAACGLDAVEAYHPDHPQNQAEAYVRWGAAIGLRSTGGADFHGPASEEQDLPGSFATPRADFEALEALARSRR